MKMLDQETRDKLTKGYESLYSLCNRVLFYDGEEELHIIQVDKNVFKIVDFNTNNRFVDDTISTYDELIEVLEKYELTVKFTVSITSTEVANTIHYIELEVRNRDLTKQQLCDLKKCVYAMDQIVFGLEQNKTHYEVLMY